eukprot:TRINITY_DN30431_c0_g1_i1.p1 TRINITY_DN30431_c0_g1~~TRINITY_DN30431_c0_g1_i1.p1  ORF type:complete len:468 (+),score=79.03 TRINITY_DN30431_c0_g1_i1:116-1519(+)
MAAARTITVYSRPRHAATRCQPSEKEPPPMGRAAGGGGGASRTRRTSTGGQILCGAPSLHAKRTQNNTLEEVPDFPSSPQQRPAAPRLEDFTSPVTSPRPEGGIVLTGQACVHLAAAGPAAFSRLVSPAESVKSRGQAPGGAAAGQSAFARLVSPGGDSTRSPTPVGVAPSPSGFARLVSPAEPAKGCSAPGGHGTVSPAPPKERQRPQSASRVGGRPVQSVSRDPRAAHARLVNALGCGGGGGVTGTAISGGGSREEDTPRSGGGRASNPGSKEEPEAGRDMSHARHRWYTRSSEAWGSGRACAMTPTPPSQGRQRPATATMERRPPPVEEPTPPASPLAPVQEATCWWRSSEATRLLMIATARQLSPEPQRQKGCSWRPQGSSSCAFPPDREMARRYKELEQSRREKKKKAKPELRLELPFEYEPGDPREKHLDETQAPTAASCEGASWTADPFGAPVPRKMSSM